MKIDLRQGRSLRTVRGAGSNMKRLIFALTVAAGLAGCAQLKELAASGATAHEEQSPFPKSSSNIAGN